MPNAGILGGKSLAASFDRNIRNYGQSGRLYRQQPSAEGDETPDVFTYPFAGTISAMLQETQKARDTANTLQVWAQRVAIAYFTTTAKDVRERLVSSTTLVSDTGYFKDAAGGVWKMHSLPAAQTAAGAVIGVAMLLAFEEKPPPEIGNTP